MLIYGKLIKSDHLSMEKLDGTPLIAGIATPPAAENKAGAEKDE